MILRTLLFSSGTTGEAIAANGALGVTETQKASNIEVGRYLLSTSDGSVVDTTDHFGGNNDLMGVGLQNQMQYLLQVEELQRLQLKLLAQLQKKNLPKYFDYQV